VDKALQHELFLITDLVHQQEVEDKFFPTTEILQNYMTKPLIGAKFKDFSKSLAR
jgi:hypothetical protein